MAAITRIPVEVYLRSSEWEPDAEYVDGEIEERSVGEFDHADWQLAIVLWFVKNAAAWGVRVIPEVRVQTSATRYRVPDVTVLSRANPVEQIITIPPVAVFEVLSPSDTILKTQRKLADYAAMGIPQIWIVDPGTGNFFRYAEGSVSIQTHFKGDEGIEFPFLAIAEMLQGR